MRECVEHFTEGRGAWKVGVLGYLARLRGIITAILIAILTAGVPFWWPNQVPQKIELKLLTLFIVTSVSIGVVILAVFFYLRWWWQKSLDSNYYLHQLAHFLRDYQTETYVRILSEQETNVNYEKDRLCGYITNICEDVKNYFRRQIGDPTIEVAIRLAVEPLNTTEGKRIVYKTVGRSSGLNRERSKTTEDIECNEGIVRHLIVKRGSQGVLIYNDLQKAADKDTFKITENERRYPDEICTMMVAPLNAWDGKAQSMIGILYVTSRRANIFASKHVDIMRFIADTIASSIACVIEQLKTRNRMPDLTRRER